MMKARTMNKTIDYYMSLPYAVIVIPDSEEGGYFAKVQELPGCMTQAETWEEVHIMIKDAMQLWLESAIEFGDPIPEPQGIGAYK